MSSNESSQLPVVSIVMSMLNAEKTLAAALRSIRMQTLDAWELILIDDGSIDGSVAVARSFDDGRIRLVHDGRNLGLATRLNQAVAVSRGEFIARMDADDVCMPDRLARQVETLQKHPALDLVGSRALVFDESGMAKGLLPVGRVHSDITAKPFVGFPLPHPTWCGRSSWFKANPYNQSLMKTQDQDLLLRSYRHSCFGGVDDVLLGYRQDKPDLRKMLRGRRVYFGSIWRQARVTGEYGPALLGMLNHAFKAAVDVLASAISVAHHIQSRRFEPVPAALSARWSKLWHQVSR